MRKHFWPAIALVITLTGGCGGGNDLTPSKTSDAPSNLVATAISKSEIQLTWEDNSSDEIGFVIERKQGPWGNFTEITRTGANITSYRDTKLRTDTTYYYRVAYYKENVVSEYSNNSSEATLKKPFSLKKEGLEIEPSLAFIQPGGHQKFIATFKDAAGEEENDVPMVWTLSGTAAADLEVDPGNPAEAFIMGISPGIVEVKVTGGGAEATVILGIDASSPRPVEISRVYPQEGSAIYDRQPVIEVNVSYRRCDCGPDFVETIRLFLDGSEVTSQTSGGGTMDIPQSGAALYYLPPSPLSPGIHTVEVHITSGLGQSSTYSWSFHVE